MDWRNGYLVQNYFDSFLPLQDGQSPLLIATWKSSGMIVAALLEADANPNFMLQVWLMYLYPSGMLAKIHNIVGLSLSKQYRAALFG